jgi:long-chain acyl-CoA synthetase
MTGSAALVGSGLRVELRKLLDGLPRHAESTITTLEEGAPVRRSFARLAEDTRARVAELSAWGVRPGMRVGLVAENSYHWLVQDLALIELRAISVPLPEADPSTTSPEAADSFGLNLVLVSKRHAPPDLGARPEVALIDAPSPPGRAARGVPQPARDDDHSLVLGSGTSGTRKGMVISRRGVEAIIEDFAGCFGHQPGDSILVFMPLWSLQQRLFFYGALAFGMDLHVVEAPNVFAAVRDLQPTVLVAPPMFYETIEARDLASLFGARTRVLIVGMAKSRASTLAYFQAKGLPLFEVYALTETGLVAANVPAAQRSGSAGRPVPGARVRIAEDGELLVAKPHFQASGYFRDSDGKPRLWENNTFWPTGDVGHLDADGFLYVDGRKDSTIVMPSGQKVQPEEIEAALAATAPVRRAVLLRPADSAFLSAVFEAEPTAELPARLATAIEAVNRRQPPWARIARFHLAAEPFSPQNGLLTPNFKLNRPAIAAAFAAEPGHDVDALVAQAPAS